VPPDEHRVAFSFEPVMWCVGLVISALTLIGLMAFGVIAWRWRRGRRAQKEFA
jgi:hypothetical protein